MIILENQDEHSPLKIELEGGEVTPSAALLLATPPPPPYVPTLPSNPIVPSYQAISHSHVAEPPRRTVADSTHLCDSLPSHIIMRCFHLHLLQNCRILLPEVTILDIHDIFRTFQTVSHL